nr:S1/P1 nuclease [Henriciella aquimarina]
MGNRLFRVGLSALVLVLTASAPAIAWDKTGHRVIGEIAARHLSPEAKAAVEDILGPEGLAEASTWPDFMRSSPEPFWQDEAYPWHYVTIPDGQTYETAEIPEEGDAITALANFREILLDASASREDKQRALRFVVHIVGDLQQPLHAGNGTDRGGNDVMVSFFDTLTNLHSVWDMEIIDRQKLSYTEWTDWLDAKISPEDIAKWSASSPADWADESAAIRDGIYPPENDRDLSYGYVYDHLGTIRGRLSKGGIRLAAYLNAVFAETTAPSGEGNDQP